MKHVPLHRRVDLRDRGTVDMVIDATYAVFCYGDCLDCLRRAIAETEARGHVFRELLKKVEVLS